MGPRLRCGELRHPRSAVRFYSQVRFIYIWPRRHEERRRRPRAVVPASVEAGTAPQGQEGVDRALRHINRPPELKVNSNIVKHVYNFLKQYITQFCFPKVRYYAVVLSQFIKIILCHRCLRRNSTRRRMRRVMTRQWGGNPSKGRDYAVFQGKILRSFVILRQEITQFCFPKARDYAVLLSQFIYIIWCPRCLRRNSTRRRMRRVMTRQGGGNPSQGRDYAVF